MQNFSATYLFLKDTRTFEKQKKDYMAELHLINKEMEYWRNWVKSYLSNDTIVTLEVHNYFPEALPQLD